MEESAVILQMHTIMLVNHINRIVKEAKEVLVHKEVIIMGMTIPCLLLEEKAQEVKYLTLEEVIMGQVEVIKAMEN